MRSIAKVISLIKIEWSLDLKRPAILASAILQMAVMALLSMLSMLSQPEKAAKIWNSLFWITLIFCTLQAISKSFLTVSRNRWIYWNQLSSPGQILWSKIIYGWLTMIILTLINLLLFGFFMGMPVIHMFAYIKILILVTGGISTIFTFIGAIASKANQAGFLAPVLSLPVILPLILLGIKASNKVFNPILVSSVNKDILMLTALDGLILVLSGILFSALWKE
jgi:heme exporter protein B